MMANEAVMRPVWSVPRMSLVMMSSVWEKPVRALWSVMMSETVMMASATAAQASQTMTVDWNF